VSVTAPRGFVSAGVASGIKGGAEADLALVAAEPRRAVPAAGVFTTNLAAAAPVRVSRAHLASSGGTAAAVVLNSGNANAATGPGGQRDAELTCELVAREIGLGASRVLVCSTGLIGIPLPIERIEAAVPRLVGGLGSSRASATGAARAIMTTDTRPKEVVVEADGFVVGGMGKGAAMLSPRMATMLAVLTTDARVTPGTLQAALEGAVDPSFNSLTIDGSTSTNDSVLALASGAAGAAGARELQAALESACTGLAEQMAADAEGGTRVATVTVTGAASDAEARAAARKVSDSLLVKCSLHGADPYWGRVVSELGSAGVAFDIGRVSVSYGGTEVCRAGAAVAHDAGAVLEHVRGGRVEIGCDLGIGTGAGSVLMTDLGHGYIDENMGTS
jgi:glutamate N-acetyltransferase/amino-acid N-acetyltransferase